MGLCAADVTSADAYADAIPSVQVTTERLIGFSIKNTHGSNGITWIIEGSHDESTWYTVEAGANVAAGATDSHQCTREQSCWAYYRVQVKSTVGGNAATAEVRGVLRGGSRS